MEDHSKEAFERLKKAHPAPKDITVKFVPVHDYLLPGIQAFTEEKKIDLIVMGTNGSSGLEEFFIGSNTEKVVRFSTIPVIALRKAPFFSAIKNIVLPSTLDLNQTEFMSRVKNLQKFFNATLHILWVNAPAHFKRDKDAKAEMHEFAKHYKLDNYTVNFRNNFYERDGIIDFTHEIKADMLAMVTHGRRGLAYLFVGSLTETVVNHADCPIWTYSIHKK
jgi:nucleotide-binding universal stress UspA family protein